MGMKGVWFSRGTLEFDPGIGVSMRGVDRVCECNVMGFETTICLFNGEGPI